MNVHLPGLSRVAVCGGTHGNELSGVYLVREMLRVGTGDEDVSMQTVLSNPLATELCRRYLDTDLNRCFTHAALNGPLPDPAPYEIVRARELNAMLGPKGSPRAVDLVCDLHNSTSNMGLCLINFSDCDWISLHIYRHLQREMPDIPVRYIHLDVPDKDSFSVASVGKHGFALEIGPQPHGVVRSNIYSAMKEGLQHILDWVRLFNSGVVFKGGPVDVFTTVGHVDYPRDGDTQNITAAIHPQLQDRDFCLLHPGDPLFQTFSGQSVSYKGSQALYPFFINECAYYEKGVALYLATKRTFTIPAVRVLKEDYQDVRFQSEEEEE
ncbi:N-acyl-aromatic-L-amino acid amidohydrolase (carboxylate-forming) B-like [Dunckerocampus dactyliophorus]|uniref:N-acyl-aromatic-L-amino acid amidohydrolase (carboxylate-forming) B-like n=1 Tax=Dunckerocampus dactyliophorus TaxID=161453 RepID=UPI002405DF28|nr:N-acyl-aromatic-L-amino acid amidohydrolase (carboxylate-forming) B-like [Dunckerocampus dactyliophorus]XP_054609012.1 N-acyl-aromatic-L-amino acid amidohydrolase (carboxylate-forming) B-like [Dunckerocampus dactyliophorus]